MTNSYRCARILPLIAVLAAAGCQPLRAVSPSPTLAAPTAAILQPTQAPPTAAVSAPTQPPVSAPTAQPVSGQVAGAVQTLLDYWTAVNAHDLARAFAYWRDGGAASGQTYEQFAAGSANTAQVTVQIGPLGTPGESAYFVAIPVTLTAISNDSGPASSLQLLQQFVGTCTLQYGQEGWRLAAARMAEVAIPTLSADLADPLALIRSYYDALNRGEYARAYTYWDNLGSVGGQSYAQFVQEHSGAGQVVATLSLLSQGGAAGSVYAEVAAAETITETTGATRTAKVTYQLRRANVLPFDQLGWRIERVDAASAAGNSPAG